MKWTAVVPPPWLRCLIALTGISGPALAPALAEDRPATSPAATGSSLFLFSDTQLSYWHEFGGSEPGLFSQIAKNVVSLTHDDAWRYGTNFLNVDVLQSDNRDPSAPWGGPGFPIPPGSGVGIGAVEVDATYRGTLGLNELTGSETFHAGPMRDLSLYFGGDIDIKNTAFAPRQRSFTVGLQVAFDVPGYFNVAAAVYKEWNHNGIVPLLGNPPGTTENVEFSTTATFEMQYMQPLSLTGAPLRVSGFTNLILPKGTDGFGVSTVAELLTDNRLTLDVGKLVADRPDRFDAFIGYRFWLNKFGNDPSPANGPALVGTQESTLYVGVAWHIF